MNKQEQLDKFLDIYQKLNPAQQSAVDHIEGPVMVVAGPGTGKTQILSARIANILLKTDMYPENILCLTFTDAGAIAMRKRLNSFIGTDAYKVTIQTHHAFCNDIIKNNVSLFHKIELNPISELEKEELMEKLIDSFPTGHPLKRYTGNEYFEAARLQHLFSTMKKEHWSETFLQEKITEYIHQVISAEEGTPYYDKFRYKRKTKDAEKGALKTKAIEEEKNKMAMLSAAVSEFGHFQSMMQEHNFYDFDDMINWVIQSFEENENLLRNYQEQYQYILIDEFQDCNGSQNRLVELLINYWESPNIFVVGDDDQCVYRFQGANLENMEKIADTYSKDLYKVVLENNYRSTQPILDASVQLIKHNKERLINKWPTLSKNLQASNPLLLSLHQPPTLIEYNSEIEEMIGITEKIKQLIEVDKIAPEKIAIISRKNSFAINIQPYLQLNNLPFYYKGSEDLFQNPFAKKIFTFFNYLHQELQQPFSGEHLLFQIMHYNWYSISAIEVAHLSSSIAEQKNKNSHTTLRHILYEKSVQQKQLLFKNGIDEKLALLSNIIEELLKDLCNEPLQKAIEHIFYKSGAVHWAMQQSNKTYYLEILHSILHFITEETHKRPYMTLQQLIALFDTMKNRGIKLPLQKTLGNEAGINLLTAHGSKGLEFAYVFLAGCTDDQWDKPGTNRGQYTLPDNLLVNSNQEAELEDARRLFYVAMTRAEKYLEISYANQNSKGKELVASQFITEVFNDASKNPLYQQINKDTITQYRMLQLLKTGTPEHLPHEEEYIDKQLANLKMNASMLNSYIECPLHFFYLYFIKMPASKSPSMEFGNAVHYALQKLFEKMQAQQQVFPPKEELVKTFTYHLEKNKECFTEASFQKKLEYGAMILPLYYDRYIQEWKKVVALERMFNKVVHNGIPMNGRIDKLEFDGKTVNIVDYKTGNPDRAKEKLAPPNAKKIYGGSYWRQAIFYKILVESDATKDWIVNSVEFDFIEPSRSTTKDHYKHKVVISADDVQFLSNLMQEVWQKIQNKAFYKGCGKADCPTCNFVKDNELYTQLTPPSEGDFLQEE